MEQIGFSDTSRIWQRGLLPSQSRAAIMMKYQQSATERLLEKKEVHSGLFI